MATIDNRITASGPAYRVRWTSHEGGQSVRRSRQFRDPQDAAAVARALEIRASERWTPEPLPRWTFRDVAEQCLSFRFTVQADTRARQVRMLESGIYPHVGETEFALVRPEQLLRILDQLVQSGRSPKTVKNYLDLMSLVFRFGVRRGWRPDNPCHYLPGPGLKAQSTRFVRTVLTPQEARLLVSCASESARPVLILLLGTGLRWGEASALTVADVRLDAPRPLVEVRQAWKRGSQGRQLGPPKSSNGCRQVPLAIGLAELLTPIIRGRAPESFLFVRRDEPLVHTDFYRHEWQPALARARQHGLSRPVRIHDLRHTFAAWTLEEASMYAAYKLLGHATSQTTSDLYGGLTQASQDRVLEVVQARLFGTTEGESE